MKTFRERCIAEMTRNVVFLFQVRLSKRGDNWITESVFLTREEGEEYGRRTEYRYMHDWRVFGVPSEGELAKLIATT